MPLFNNNQSTPETTSSTPVELKVPTLSQESWATNNNKVTINSLLTWIHGDSDMPSRRNIEPSVSQVQERRFISVKYKIYTLAIITLLIVVYGPISSAIQTSLSKREQWNKIDQTINQRIDQQSDYKTKTELLKSIEANKENIVSCINENRKCEQLPEEINNNSDIIKAYIQIWNLKKEKMEVNESKILKTINEFMTKANILSIERKYNGTVTNIDIWDTKSLENNIIQVPVSMTVTFDTKENLINFISNIENNIFYSQTDWLNDSILYRIEELKYDIVNYKETQDVAVVLSAYAYNE